MPWTALLGLLKDWKNVTMLVLLVICIGLGVTVKVQSLTIDNLKLKNMQMSNDIDRQNEAIKKLHDDGVVQQKKIDKITKENAKLRKDLNDFITDIRENQPKNVEDFQLKWNNLMNPKGDKQL